MINIAVGLGVEEVPGKGRGVIAQKTFEEGDIIEECPVLVVENDAEEYPLLEKTIFDSYLYDWKGLAAMVLGYGSIYNHSYKPNAYYKRDFDRKVMQYIALKKINPGEEIVINYNGDPTDTEPIGWFNLVD